MTRDKDRKRIVRDRMKKTGESYTTARAHVLARAAPKHTPAPAVDYGRLAGMKDQTIAARTGRTWQEWVRLLDADNAATLAHIDIAKLLHGKHHVGDWWAQTVTVGYERIKGLRERGQRRGGTYEATKSKTFDVPVTELFDAWADEPTRRRWLTGVKPVVRSAKAPKAMRLHWPDGTIVVAGFIAKSRAKSAVALVHSKLRDKAASEQVKKFWGERLDALASVLKGS